MSLALQARDITRIMPLGDSITYGDHSDSTGGYRGPLWTTLSTESRYTLNFVGSQAYGIDYQNIIDPTFDLDNEGHNGWPASWINADISVFLTNNPADIVLLHIGTNDVKLISDPADPAITNIVETVESILDNIDTFDPQIKVILARIINYDSSSAARDIITEYNRQLAVMAENRIANGDDIEIVDMENGAGIDYSTDMDDMLHPNDLGYTKIAHLWSEKLKTIIPVHQWKLDEQASPFIDNRRDVYATCTMGCPLALQTISGRAQLFSDTTIGGLDVNDTSSINWEGNTSFTIELWMKSDRGDAMQGDGTVSDAIFLGRVNASDTPDWYIGTSQVTGKAIFYLDTVSLTGSDDITDGNWHHIACVRDAEHNKTSFYVDGVLNDDINVNSVTLSATTTPLNIGYLDWNTGCEYNGALDDIKMYGAALSTTQIQQHYDREKQQPMRITTAAVTFNGLNRPYYYDVNSSHDPLATYTLNSTANWMLIDTDSGVITGTTDTVGNFDVTVHALDETSAETETAMQNYMLKVRDISALPDNMVHYWKLDETAGSTYMDAYLGSDGECTEGCPIASSGKINGSQIFSDTNAGGIDVNDSAIFNWTENDDFTISFWMKSNDKGAHQSNGNYSNAVMFGRKDKNEKLLWFIGTDRYQGGKILFQLSGESYGDGTSIVTDSKWHHIAWIRDTNKHQNQIYVDGVLENNTTITTHLRYDGGGTPVNIGYLNWADIFKYNGYLDEIKVYSGVLSQAEIIEEFQSPKYHIEILKKTDGAEPDKNVSFTVKVTPINSNSKAILGNIHYSGTANEGVDYATGPTKFSIAPGESETVIELPTIDDSIFEGPEDVIATISTLSVGNLGTDRASATIADDDVVGVKVDPVNGLTTTEAGGTTTFTVRLKSEPLAGIEINLSSSDLTEGTVFPASLSFTGANWQTAQTVTVTGVDDVIVDGNVSYIIVTSKTISIDPNYDGLNVDDVSVTNSDDDSHGVYIAPVSGLKTTENGGTDTFKVQLTSKPTADVSIHLHSSEPSEGTVSDTLLTFTVNDWQTAQTVTITGMDDSEKDGDIDYKIVISTVSSDSVYHDLAVEDVSVTNIDNDTNNFSIVPILGLLLL